MPFPQIDESHDLIVEPGPYPPGEGALDYAECRYRCADWAAPCTQGKDEDS